MGQGFQVSLYGLLAQDQLIPLLDKLSILSGQIEPQLYDLHDLVFIPQGTSASAVLGWQDFIKLIFDGL